MRHITIVGLGLMGGSLAAVCRKKFPKAKITGISRDTKALKLALSKKWVHEATSDFRRGVSQADLVILCTPVSTFESLLKQIERFAKPGVLVSDVGSVKKKITAWAEQRTWKKLTFVGAHPMMGSHQRGIEAAHAHLYDRGYIFITSSSKIPKHAFESVKSFWKKINSHVIEITAKDHDRIAAQVSHLPHFVATALVLAVEPKSLAFASGGFMDTTRVAQGNGALWFSIFQANQKAVIEAVNRFEHALKALKQGLRRPSADFQKMLEKASKIRSQISL